MIVVDSGVRSIALSSDSSHVVTCADDCTKVWAVDGLRLVQTLDTPQAVCATFVVTSFNYVAVGTREGALHICDVQAGLVIQSLEDAHTGNIWSLVCSRDGKTVVSAGSDKQVCVYVHCLGVVSAWILVLSLCCYVTALVLSASDHVLLLYPVVALSLHLDSLGLPVA